MIINNLNNLLQVLDIKNKHSKFINEDDTYFFDDLSFKVDRNRLFSHTKHYLDRFTPFLYYEWSRRKYENISENRENRENSTGGNMCIFCIAIRNDCIFTTIVFNMFSLDTTDFLKQMKEKNEDLNKFCFNNLKLSFIIDDETEPSNETTTFLNELCDLKARDVDLDVFFINQYITTGEYSLLKEEYEEETHDNIHYFIKTKKEEKVINNYESYKSDECVICYIEKPDILFCNCGHIAICTKCDELTENNKCPVCRHENTIKRKIDY